jgi:hypothetical protein
MAELPAPNPCGSCPYRRDVPSGVWDAKEYDKLPAYDGETFEQPPAVFMCHQQDGRVCAGWAGCHDMDQSLAVRMGIIHGTLDPAIYDYETPVPLFSSGAEAAEHGKAEIKSPGEKAIQKIHTLTRRRARA